MFSEIFLGTEKNFSRKVILFHAAILLMSVLFLYFFSYSTSPRYFFVGNDSLIFQVVGKCWTEGLLPYVGAFENKGPLLFLINALGYIIYPRFGIMLLQIPFMYFSMLFMWRAVELYWSRRATFIIFLFMIFWRASIFREGNRTEEYSMPFLIIAAYFFLRYLKEEKNFLEPFVGFIYGLGFGACVLLRTTNGLPICCYVLITTFFLIRAGAFKNIWQNFLSFCTGFVIICLPFVIYFAAHGALYDMLYGTILLNTNYATGYDTHSAGYVAYMIPYAVKNFYILFWMVIASIFAIVLNIKSKLAWSGLISGSAMLFMLIKSRPFPGYLELIVSLLPIFFAVIYELKTKLTLTLKRIWSVRGLSLKRIFCKATVVLLLPFILLSAGSVLIQILTLCGRFIGNNSEESIAKIKLKQIELNDFQKIIPADERNSVVFWGGSQEICLFILESKILPRCRYFANVQMFFGKSDPAVIDEWIQNVRSDYPKWIVYNALEEEFLGEEQTYFNKEFRSNRNLEVEKILSDKYTFTTEMKNGDRIMKLYRFDEKKIY